MDSITSQISGPSNNSSWGIESVQPTQPGIRLRSACDACHEAKTKCSGGNLENACRSCQDSQKRCTYSLGRRLGRPKGSKNKRPQRAPHTEKENDNEKKSHGNDKDTFSWNSGETQKRSISSHSFTGFDFEQTFNAQFPGNADADHIFDDILNLPDFAYFMDVSSDIQDDLDSISDQAPSFSFTQPALGIETPPESVRHDSVVAASSPSSTSNNHSRKVSFNGPNTSSDGPTCTCLQQHVRLVYQLGDLQDFHSGGPTVDRVLQCVELAQEPWENLMKCSWCHSLEYQKEVFLLFATSIRILLSAIQRLESETDPTSADTTLRNFATSGGRSVSDIASTINGDVLVGSFKLTGEARAEVIKVVLRRAMRIVTSASLHLKNRVGPSISEMLPDPSINTR